jgi:hypothetical protein
VRVALLDMTVELGQLRVVKASGNGSSVLLTNRTGRAPIYRGF